MKKRMKTRSIYIFLAALIVVGSFLTAYIFVSRGKGTNPKMEHKASKSIDFNSYVNEVSKLVKLNWPSMNKVWPTYNYNNHNFLIFNLDEKGKVKEARLLNINENRSLKKEEYAHITPPNPEGYDQLEFQGKPSIVMSVDDNVMKTNDSVKELYKTATHEIVHFYYQGEIQTSSNSSRSQIYPIDRTPRIARRMLYKRLIQAFENPNKKEDYLGKAKYWLEKYKTEFKSEADSIKATDIAESTARYTENLGVFIGKNLSKQAARKEAEKFIKKDEIFIAADKESYEIGYVAGLILDDKKPNWKQNFYSTKKGIEEVLLEDVTAVPDKPDEKLVNKVTNKIDNANQDAKVKLKNVITANKDTNIPLLHLDVSKGSKSFYAETMFRYQNLSVMAGYSSKFNVGGKSVDIKNSAIISGYEGGKQYIRIPLTMKYEIKEGKLTIKSENINVDGISVKTSKENGRTIYSAEAQD